MPYRGLRKFGEMLRTHRREIMAAWREKLHDIPAAQRLDAPALADHIDLVLADLAAVLQREDTKPVIKLPIGKGAHIHGVQRLHEGFNLLEVVAEYNLLRETLLEFAGHQSIRVSGQVNVVLNRVIDKAIAVAVHTYGDQKSLQLQKSREEHFSFIVHDLKTPLSAIATAANIVERSLPSTCKDERVSRMIGIVQRNARHLNTLVSKILEEQSRVLRARGNVLLSAVETRQVDLWPLVEDLMQSLNPLAETANTTLKNEVPSDCILTADPELVRRVFQNLISNAIDYTTGGQVVVGAAAQPEGGVQCWVCDNGRGIPEDRLDRIFDRLEADPAKPGSFGMGLPLL